MGFKLTIIRLLKSNRCPIWDWKTSVIIDRWIGKRQTRIVWVFFRFLTVQFCWSTFLFLCCWSLSTLRLCFLWNLFCSPWLQRVVISVTEGLSTSALLNLNQSDHTHMNFRTAQFSRANQSMYLGVGRKIKHPEDPYNYIPLSMSEGQ